LLVLATCRPNRPLAGCARHRPGNPARLRQQCDFCCGAVWVPAAGL